MRPRADGLRRPPPAAAGALLALAAWLAAPAAAPGQAAGTEGATTAREAGATAAGAGPEVRRDTVQEGGVRPGDLIRLTVWGEEELTGELPVDESGVVVVPKVGRRQVGGMTPDQVEALVVEELGAYLRTPAIDVTVLRTVKVLGSVTKPGLYNVDPTRSVRDALAMAGGVSPVGNAGDIRVVRGGRVLAEEVSLDASLMGTAVQSGDEIYVPEKSWFARNSGAVISGSVGLLSVIAAIVVR